MTFELDHLFIWTAPGAPAAQPLIDAGFAEGPSNIHPGQGTANRRFFFENTMLELLWVHDIAEALGEGTAPTTLGDRFLQQGVAASAFGLCLRPHGAVSGEPPFAGWRYQPSYLPAPLSVWVGGNAPRLAEPFLFYLSFGKRPDAVPVEKRPPLVHPVGAREITTVRLRLPYPLATASPQLKLVADTPGIIIESGVSEQMELIFDRGQAGRSLNFWPHLPLIVHL